jgi:hypothetical protein
MRGRSPWVLGFTLGFGDGDMNDSVDAILLSPYRTMCHDGEEEPGWPPATSREDGDGS